MSCDSSRNGEASPTKGWRRWLYPAFDWRLLGRMGLVAVMGALISGGYGILHDQITYSISEEYFTKMKFEQFRGADFGFPKRVFVGEIGFLATWWVGLLAGWFLGRMAVPVWPMRVALRKCLLGFALMTGVALLAGVIGNLLGIFHGPDYSFWRDLCWERGVVDVPNFARVGIIHYASYLGGLVGLIAAMVMMLRMKRAGILSRDL